MSRSKKGDDDEEEFDARPLIEQLMPIESDVTFESDVVLLASIDEMTDADRLAWGPPADPILTGWVPGNRPDTPRLAPLPKRRGKKRITGARFPNATHWRTWDDELAGIPPEPIPAHRIGDQV